MNESIREAVAGLRQLAEFLETNADRLDGSSVHGGVTMFGADPATVARMPGGWEKKHEEHSVELGRRFDGGIRCTAWFARELVCERVATGNKVTRRVPVAWDDVEEDEYEWECAPMLADR